MVEVSCSLCNRPSPKVKNFKVFYTYSTLVYIFAKFLGSTSASEFPDLLVSLSIIETSQNKSLSVYM